MRLIQIISLVWPVYERETKTASRVKSVTSVIMSDNHRGGCDEVWGLSGSREYVQTIVTSFYYVILHYLRSDSNIHVTTIQTYMTEGY